MRQTKAFKLINGVGSELDLSSNDLFFTKISGIGFEQKNELKKIGSHFYNVSKSLIQKEISGDMHIFGEDSAHEKYKELVDFCMIEPLKLVYMPQKIGRMYYLDVIVKNMEISKRYLQRMDVKVVFEALGLFYRDEISSILNGGSGKVYPYQYPYQYNDVDQGTAFVDVDSTCPSGTIIEIFGPCKNPTWKYFVEGTLIGEGKANVNVLDDQKLVIDTTKSQYSITIRDLSNQLISDAYNKCDFSTKRFFLTKKGRNRVSVISDEKTDCQVLLKARIEYASI